MHPTTADAFDLRQVAPGFNLAQPRLQQQLAHRSGLVVAMLDQQAAARPKVSGDTADDRANASQTVAAKNPISQRHLRFKRQAIVLQVRIGLCDIRRIGDCLLYTSPSPRD